MSETFQPGQGKPAPPREVAKMAQYTCECCGLRAAWPMMTRTEIDTHICRNRIACQRRQERNLKAK